MSSILRNTARTVVPPALRRWRLTRLSRREAIRAYLQGRTRHDLIAYEEQIQHFWTQHYGRAIDTTEHLMFTAVTGVEDVRFMPGRVYRREALPLVNDLEMRPAFLDKNLSDIFIRCDGRIHHIGTLARFGTNHAFNDNVATGGVFVRVEESGTLHPEALDKAGTRYSSHPTTGVSFAEVRIPNAKAFVRFAADLHRQVLPFDLISWDLVVATGGVPALLELNFIGPSRLFQWGLRRGFFGAHTADVLEAIASRRE